MLPDDDAPLAATREELDAPPPAEHARAPSGDQGRGRVAFLFTEMVDSAARWETAPAAMAAALARHDALIGAALVDHGGKVHGKAGTAFTVAFADPARALRAALDAQAALQREPWDEAVGPLLVRMALDLDPPEPPEATSLAARAPNRPARMLSVAHGGQVLLSAALAAALDRGLPSGVRLRPLGVVHLRDLQEAEPLYQVDAPEAPWTLPTEFPPLGSQAGGPALPVPPHALIGRAAAAAAVAALMTAPTGRLLTVTGPGGVGKTSLALAVAHALAPAYPAGVAWVPLAAVTAPAGVVPAIAGALGLREIGETPVTATLRAYLQARAILLVLDNVEQVVAAAAEIGGLLAAAPGLQILATSRVPLRLRGERVYPLPPLARPDPAHLPPLAALSEVAAVALFVERAQAVQPAFALTADNAAPVAQICARLDGLPLALELAAARLRLFSPAALLARLERALPLLTGGPRDAPLRHQTLRATIAWSYALLSAEEQSLFRRISVFAGGAPLAGVAAVCAAEDALGELLDRLTALLDHSLLTQAPDADGEPRFQVLETLREYAAEQLAAAGEAGTARTAHAAYYTALVAQAEPALQESRQAAWLARLEEEHDNLRATLAGLLAAGDPAAAVLAGAVWRFWYVRGHLTEGWRFLAAVSALPAVPAALRAKVLNGAGVLALAQDAYPAARTLLTQSLDLYWTLDHELGMASALNNLGIVTTEEGDYPAAQAYHEEALALRRRLGDQRTIAASLNNLGAVAGIQRDPRRARGLFAEALALRRGLSDTRGVALVLANLGDAARDVGDAAGATGYYEESVALYRALGDRVSLSLSLTSLADLYSAARDLPAALRLYEESLSLSLALGSPAQQAANLRGLAACAVIAGRPALAARLFGAAEAAQDPQAAHLPPAQQAAYDAAVAQARAAIAPTAWTAAWATGRAQSAAAILAALPFPELQTALAPDPPIPAPPGASELGLTRREREVLRLLVAGLSYNEIADQLTLSFHTVHAHLRAIYSKLGVTSRAQAVRVAGEQRLV